MATPLVLAQRFAIAITAAHPKPGIVTILESANAATDRFFLPIADVADADTFGRYAAFNASVVAAVKRVNPGYGEY